MNFNGLYAELCKIDFFGRSGSGLPQDLPAAVAAGTAMFPNDLQVAYATPLQKALPTLQMMVSNGKLPAFAFETMVAPVTQLRPSDDLSRPLGRFLAVASNAYRSFLSPHKRLESGMPVRGVLPPVAMFQSEGNLGPFTVTIEDVEKLIGGQAAVASLPATYASHPLIWAILSHEVGGHAFTHADPGLIEQITRDLASLIAASRQENGVPKDQLATVWAYWTDEIVSDVFATLNIGPGFGINMAAFFSAVASQGGVLPPKLRMSSRANSADPKMILDPHPADILRLGLVYGATEALTDLSPAAKEVYLTQIQELIQLLSDGDTVTISGNIPVDGEHLMSVNLKIPLTAGIELARNTGRHIATVSLQALGGRGIQELETWDDFDEERTRVIQERLLGDNAIEGLGDDAQLLAGATLALLERPQAYAQVSAALNEALDDSYQRDPIWGAIAPKQMLYHDNALWSGALLKEARVQFWTAFKSQ